MSLRYGALAALVMAALHGCGGRAVETEEGASGSSGRGGMGGAPGQGGIAGRGGTTSPGGSVATGGSGPAGGFGSGGELGPGCMGIRNREPCVVEGYTCADLTCGIADLGHRSCSCNAVWNCTACELPFDPVPPSNAAACTTQADGQPCAVEGAICVGAPNAEVCLCYRNNESMLIWDCDDPWWT